MTRGPAKPMSARGSAKMTSPSMAKLAVTPPVVGSASTEMNKPLASSRRASAALVLAICMSEKPDSCMRAPPEHETVTTGMLWSMPRSIARVIFSPTTEPIDPPRKVKSITATTTRRPFTKPKPERSASFSPVLRCASLMRWPYGRWSTNLSGSTATRPSSNGS